MIKFWDWMNKKNYGRDLGKEKVVFFTSHVFGRQASKQMLVGYMIEYLLDKEVTFEIEFLNWDDKQTINEIYNYLEKKINNLEGINGKNKVFKM